MIEISNQNYNRYTPALVISNAIDIGVSDNTWIDQGSVVNVEGFTKMLIWVKLTVNNSTGNQLQILSGEGNSTATHVLPTESDYLFALGDADITNGVMYSFDLYNAIKYVQFQTKATVIGATEGTITINITLGY